MNSTYFETANLADIHSTYCFKLDILHTHAQHNEALARQLLSLELLEERANSIVHNLDNKSRGLQAVLLAPGIYASADMPTPDRE